MKKSFFISAIILSFAMNYTFAQNFFPVKIENDHQIKNNNEVDRYNLTVTQPTNEGTDFLPLNTGNKWQYIITNYDPDGPSYSMDLDSVTCDTLIENKVYYKTTKFSDLIRYDNTDNIIYIRWDDQDHAHINFNVPPDSFYQIYSATHNYISVYATGGEDSIFNKLRVYSGYLYITSGWGYTIEYTDSIGTTYERSAGDYFDESKDLIEAIIYDSSGNRINYTYQRKPRFQIQPIIFTDSSEFQLDFKVLHSYTRILPGGSPPWHVGLDFIDSVKMFSFYSKNDSVITNPLIIPDHESIPVNTDYTIYKELDTSLMKNGFTFNYWFIAKDKGIIPEYSYSPDSGYYQCIWKYPVNTDRMSSSPSRFFLFQNYPNPFNPSTVIKYQVPELSKVKLTVYDVLGREIKTLVNEEKPVGSYEVEFSAKGGNLSSGIYFYRIEAGKFSDAKKFVLLK
ncbi:MAG TPA: T9SS type A sorting domain-containing protein [Ignavibacteriaceae bacterium]|nr:T9SS type A sorting domain-containing protein [Ignavibacteriaceae bacterium]